jgi:hypothetical protein
MARVLLLLSAILFGVTGFGYLVVPGVMLSVVGIDSGITTDFLIRTEGVALLCAATLIWAARDVRAAAAPIVLVALAAYYIVGSVVDLAAFGQGVVGVAAVPTAAGRIVIGCLCLISAVGLSRRGPRTSDGQHQGH